LYARISSDRDGDGLGVRRQELDCEALAERLGWLVVDRYVDNDVSAYRGKARPEYRRLLEDIAARQLDALVVWHLDRLHRHPRELEDFFEVIDAAGGVKMATVSGETDLGTHDGRLMARIQGAVARKESDDKSRRVKRKAQELAAAGKVSGGGTRPFGYEPDKRTIRESEAAVIRDCVTRLLAGESIRSLAADLNARGVPTVTGRPWKTQTLRTILMNPRISGQRTHHGEIANPVADWPAIITPAQTQQIRAKLTDPARRTNRTARRYLLVRLLKCERCGETLVSRPTSNGTRRYVCAKGPNFSGCGRTYIKADELERFVTEAVLYRLDSPELAAALNGASDDPDAERLQALVDEEQAQLDELARLHGEKQIGLSEWLAARAPVEQRLTAARKQLGRLGRATVLNGHVGNGAELRERWAGLDLTRQTAIVAAVLDHVVVGPTRRQGSNRFDESRLTPVWRV
jgi:DNA invertase Pin-like site-specific DNA recombinase